MGLTVTAEVSHASFLLGRNAAGHWVLRDTAGTQSGTFRSREAAVRFAQLLCGDRNALITPVPDGLEPVRLDRIRTEAA